MSLILGGEVVPHTDWIRVDKQNAWWPNFDFQTLKRENEINLLCGHWTAGEAGLKSYDDDGPRVVSAMKHRMSETHVGRRLKVSVGFVIGACEPDDEYAPIWQTMDIGVAAGCHVGGVINRRSIGVEIVNAGAPGKFNTRNRPTEKRYMVGATRKVLPYYPGQMRTWQRLCDLLTLATADKVSLEEAEITKYLQKYGIRIPRQVPVAGGKIITRRMTRGEISEWKGIMEHYMMYSTKKIDAGMYCLESCLKSGYLQVSV